MLAFCRSSLKSKKYIIILLALAAIAGLGTHAAWSSNGLPRIDNKTLARLAQLDQALSCQMLPLSSSSADADEGQATTPQPSSCQLNGKWLSAASLLCVEQLFFAIAFVIALLVPLSRRAPALPPPINVSPPERRLHLTLCVWRE